MPPLDCNDKIVYFQTGIDRLDTSGEEIDLEIDSSFSESTSDITIESPITPLDTTPVTHHTGNERVASNVVRRLFTSPGNESEGEEIQ